MVQYRQFKNISLFLSERSLSWNTKKKLAAAVTIIRMNILIKKSIADVDTIIRMIIPTIIITNIHMKKIIADAATITRMIIPTIITDIPTRMADAAVTKKRNRHIITPMTKICCITKKICPTS